MKRIRNNISPLLLFSFAFSAAMAAVMVFLTVYRSIHAVPGENLAVMIGNILLWLVPFASKWLFREKISDGIYFFFAVYAFFASFLGSVMSFYGKFWWFDIVIHTIFGYVACVIGLFAVCKLCDIRQLSAPFALLICVAVSLALAVFWEIFEFASDSILQNAAGGIHAAQGKPVLGENGEYFIPVNDTMADMICHTCGAGVFAVHYALHTLTKKSLFIGALKKDFSSGGSAETAEPAETAAARNDAPDADTKE